MFDEENAKQRSARLNDPSWHEIVRLTINFILPYNKGKRELTHHPVSYYWLARLIYDEVKK